MKSPVNGAGNGAIVPAPVHLFDLVSGNFFSDFASEDEAWEELRRWAAESGPEELRGLALMRYLDGHPTLIAMEEDLVRRALGDDDGISSDAEVGASRSRRAS